MLRELRAADAPRLVELLKSNFPEEEALLGTRPEGVAKIIHRVFRWDTRLILGLLRLAGRPFFRLFIIDADGGVVATTMLSFSERAGYVSMVMVDAAHRRKGLARRLLEEARGATARQGRRYIALDVLEGNAPARSLYESIGYRLLRTRAFFAHEAPSSLTPPRPTPEIRPFRRPDTKSLVEVARRSAPARVVEVLPVHASDITAPRWANRILDSRSAGWVFDRGRGAEAYVGATTSPLTEAAHLTGPIVGESVDPEAAGNLVLTAGAWLAPHSPRRILSMVSEDNERGRAALEAVGFQRALPLLTLYRESA